MQTCPECMQTHNMNKCMCPCAHTCKYIQHACRHVCICTHICMYIDIHTSRHKQTLPEYMQIQVCAMQAYVSMHTPRCMKILSVCPLTCAHTCTCSHTCMQGKHS